MSSQQPSGFSARRVAATTALVALALLTLVSAAPAPAGTAPNRLDDNRGAVSVQIAVNLFVTSPPLGVFFVPFPFLLPPPIGPLSSRVLENPRIFNVYWDDDWDDHHAGAFTTESIDNMTKKLVESNYFDFAGQYDVGPASFDDSNTSGGFFNPCDDTPGAVTNFLDILEFIECETSLAPTGVPSPGGDSLYVVYLPRGTTIDNFGFNQSCDSFGAYHFMGTTLTFTGGKQVAFAVVPIDCAHGSADELSTLASHEIIEASTDPNVVMGWIDNSKFDITNLQPLFTEGEAADICGTGGDEATDPVRLDNGIMVATYWSNADNACVPKIPTSTTYNGPTSGDYNDSVTLSATLTKNLNSQGVAGKAISFTLGAESCSGITNTSGVASCSVTPLDVPGSGYNVQATFAGDAAYVASGASSPFTVNQEESALAYGGPVTSHYHDAITASATMTDPDGGAPIASKSVTFTLGVGDTCTASTRTSGVASCSITPTQTGTKTISAVFSGDTYYLSSSGSKSFSITPEETTMTYSGPTVILAGASGATLTATLVEEGTNDADGDPGPVGPNPAETVTLSVGSQSCTGTTNSSGNVTCTIPSISVPLGPQTVGASFAGDAYYQAASNTTTAIVFAFPSSGVFMLGSLTVASAGPTTNVNWWNSNWNRLNILSGGVAPSSFKGFVATVTLPNQTPANVCSGNWTSAGGNSGPPPATVPSYMGVTVDSKITKQGNTISGSYTKIVVVKTDPGYAPGPGNAGRGKIVATFC